MNIAISAVVTKSPSANRKEHRDRGCGGTYDALNGDYDCEYQPTFTCDDCMFRSDQTDKRKGKDPLAETNQKEKS